MEVFGESERLKWKRKDHKGPDDRCFVPDRMNLAFALSIGAHLKLEFVFD
jgi:hypothetical protein